MATYPIKCDFCSRHVCVFKMQRIFITFAPTMFWCRLCGDYESTLRRRFPTITRKET